MSGRTTIRAELEEQRCLIERQQVEILRHKHHIEMQRRRMAHLEAELDAIKVTSQRAAATMPSTQQSNGNGNGHRAARHVSRETISSSDQA
jgi:hypothetical protein